MTQPVAMQEIQDGAALGVTEVGSAAVSLKATAALNAGGRLTGGGAFQHSSGGKASLRALAPILESSLVGLPPEKMPAGWISLRAVGMAAAIADMQLKIQQKQKMQQLAERNEIMKLEAETRRALYEYVVRLLDAWENARAEIINEPTR